MVSRMAGEGGQVKTAEKERRDRVPCALYGRGTTGVSCSLLQETATATSLCRLLATRTGLAAVKIVDGPSATGVGVARDRPDRGIIIDDDRWPLPRSHRGVRPSPVRLLFLFRVTFALATNAPPASTGDA